MTDKEIEKILNICNKYSFAGYYSYGNIPDKKLNNAISSFPIPLDDEVLALIDSTIFGSCKTGLAVCVSGVYWKNNIITPSKENYLSWKKFKKAEILHNVKVNANVEDVQIGYGNFFRIIDNIHVGKLLKDLQCTLKGDFFENVVSFVDNADNKVNQVNEFVGKAFSFLENLGATMERYAEKLPVENKIIEVIELNESIDDSSQYVSIEATMEGNACPPPLPKQENWHIAINEQQEGPYDIFTIKNLVRERNISEMECHVWKKGMENWSLMSEVDEFEEKKDTASTTSNTSYGNYNNNNSSTSSEQNTTQSSEKIIIICENCLQKMRVPKKASRIIVTCPKCRKEFRYQS